MATQISLSSGSILNGNPITLDVKPTILSSTPSFHRIIFEVECGMSGGNYETIKLSQPVQAEDGAVQQVDISSALRTFRDSYAYTPNATTYPVVKFNVKVYDEYMLNGVVNQVGTMYFPKYNWKTETVNGEEITSRDDTAYLRTIFGAFSDMERLKAGGATKSVQSLTRKPTTLPEVVAVGETYAYTAAYGTAQALVGNNTLTGPTSTIHTISASDLGVGKTEGALTLGGHSLYALPASKAAERQVFRFINGFGVLESVSVPRVYKKQVEITSTPYVVARQETFNSFSRSTVRKTNNREAWMYSTDPMDEKWMSWYIHEFLMAEHVWMDINGTWVACTITPEEETTLRDDTERTMYSLAFSVKLDINGSPIL